MARSGAADGFAPFFREQLPAVYGYLLHLSGGERALAEDLTQETFLALTAELKLGRTERADPRWLLTVARHRFINHIRREQLGRSKLRLLVADARADETPEPTSGQVLATMGRLDPLHRVALMMRYVDGLSVPEIAVAMDRTTTATHSLLARARDQLRRAMEEGR